MNTPPLKRLFAMAFVFAIAVGAARSETTLALDIGFGTRFVPPSRVTVPSGERLAIIAPDFGSLQWFKNGQPIAGATGQTLLFQSVKVLDGGSYHAIYTAPEMAGRVSQSLILGVGQACRLVNLSTRAQVGAGEKTFIAGFVVTGAEAKKIIVRAIGPTLAAFGINEPVARPAIAIFDGAGDPYTNGYVYPAVVGGPTYETDLAESLAKAGAFPLPAGSNDVVEMRPFIPGAYTVHVTSADGTPGIVLVEIYEVP